MADDSGYGAAIAGAAVTAAGNYAITAASNKRQFKYQQAAMDKQLAQNKELWDYQNAYNTPAQQMERLKAAGLNPRLVYGSGSSGGNVPSGDIESPQQPVREATKGEVPDVMLRRFQQRAMDSQYAATNQKIANMQTTQSLLEIQRSIAASKDIMDKASAKFAGSNAQTANMLNRFAAYKSKQLLYNEQSKGQLLDQNYELRQKAMTGLDLDNEFKKNRNKLAEWGIYQSDSPLLRTLMVGARRMGVDLQDLLKEGKEKLRYLFH